MSLPSTEKLRHDVVKAAEDALATREGRTLLDDVEQSVIEIGEVKVRIKTGTCCGNRFWYGQFPNGTICCYGTHNIGATHDTRNEAILCSKLRVATDGFQMVLPARDSALDYVEDGETLLP